MFTQDLIQIAVLVLLALSCGLLGPFLVLRRQTMLANSISHTILLGIALAFWLENALAYWKIDTFLLTLICAALVAWLTGFITQKVEHGLKVQADASIGLVFSLLFSLGIIAVSACFPHSHIGLEIIMGNADALGFYDIYPMALTFLFNSLILGLFFKEYKLSSFDRSLSLSLGFSPSKLDYLLMIQVSLTMMVGFRVVGAFLVLSFLIGPALCARFLTHNLKAVVAYSILIGASSALISCLVARFCLSFYYIPLSTAALSSTLLLLFFMSLWSYAILKAHFKRKEWGLKKELFVDEI